MRMNNEQKTSDFYYELPQELIAQVPAEKRDGSRLLVLPRVEGDVCHRHFFDIKEFLRPGDVLVLNDTKVIPARLYGRKATGAKCEILLLKHTDGDLWKALVNPGKRLKPGSKIIIDEKELSCTVEAVEKDGVRLLKFNYDGIFNELLDKYGNTPLPPYITSRASDKSRYQTVYADKDGSAAAPTAGLHFTEQLLDDIRSMGVDIVKITLHVGLGTFRPVKEEIITDHIMHSEEYTVSEDAAKRINAARKAGGRVIAVGTTSCRTLETVADDEGVIHAGSGNTQIFIYPGYKFKGIDGLITNFHLPESTLIMLVSAFSTKERIMKAYEIAVKERYRFFSFGDAMLII